MAPAYRRLAAVLIASAMLVAGCDSSAKHTTLAPSTTSRPSSTSTGPAPAADLAAAEHPRGTQFPSEQGKTLQQVANLVKAQVQLGAATGTFTPGMRHVAFAISTTNGAFVYGPTAIYIAKGAGKPADGPFLAPADPMTVAASYRSKENSGPGGIQAIYSAQVPVSHAGTYTILALTHTPQGLVGAPGEIAVAASSPIPDVGQRPPAIATDTPASVAGKTALLTTRIPPDDMSKVSFKDVLGKRPIALLFSTPQLCQSKVCGPVTDIAAQLEHEFAGRVTFIHEEVYVNNQPSQGLRPQLKAFHLQTEPWLFTINRRGVIAARLEGAFGTTGFRRAVEAALR
jgi:hypothetical protein